MPINLIADNLSSINSVKDIRSLYDSRETKEEKASASKNLKNLEVLTLKDLSYSVGDKTIFKDFTYRFERGKSYLVMGSSGRGKSTLAYLMTANIEPNAGRVIYNDLESRETSYQDIQKNISLISQHSIVFTDTLLNNLHLYQPMPIDKTKQLLKLFHLSDRFANMDEKIVEDGNLSGGQKQRLIIIRALLQGKPFVILDESLSALDKENYEQIENYLLERKDICLINITHRESSHKAKYDELLNLDEWA